MGLQRRGGSEQTSSVQTHVPHDTATAVHRAIHRPAARLCPSRCRAVPQAGGCGSRHRTPGGAVASPPRGPSPCGQAQRAGTAAEPRPPPDSRSAARNRSAFNHCSINYSAALIINFLHSNPVPGESPSFLATVQRETNFPPSARGPTPPLLIPLLQTMPKQYSQR